MKRQAKPLKTPKITMTPELREFYRKQGAIGGRAAAANMTEAQRKARARRARAARDIQTKRKATKGKK